MSSPLVNSGERTSTDSMDFTAYFVSSFLKSKGSECYMEHLFSKPTETPVFIFFYMK